MDSEKITAFWQAYLASLPPGADRAGLHFSAWAFGDNPALAGELLELVKSGRKTATCSSLPELQASGEPLPEVGELSLILDGDGQPGCIIRTTSVEFLPFGQVDAAFAYDEGEDDRSLASWQENHRRYFSRTHQRLGLPQPSADMQVVCEHFEVVFLHPLFLHDIISA